MEKQTTQKPKSMAAFYTIWAGQAASLLGSRLVQFSLVWYLTESTGSATVLAAATLAALVPEIFLGPFAGALVDRWNRRTVMIVADGLIALSTLGLAALFAFGLAEIWHIYALMFLRSLGGAFHWPAMQASTTLLVPEEQYSRVAGMNQLLQGAMGIAAPPLGALLLEVLPMQGVLAIDVGTAMLAILPLAFIHIPQPERQAGENGSTVLGDMREGFRFVWSWKGMVLIIAMAMIINLVINPAFVLLPLVVTEHFNGGALQLAWLEAAWSVGIVLGGLILSIWGGFKRRILTAMIALVIQGFFIAAFGFVPGTLLLMGVGFLFAGGFMNSFVNGSLFATMQSSVPPEIQGRVFTLLSSGVTAMMPIGLVVAAPVADLIGVNTWFVIGGLIASALGVWAFFTPAVMTVEEQGKERMAGHNASEAVASTAVMPVEAAEAGIN